MVLAAFIVTWQEINIINLKIYSVLEASSGSIDG